MPADEFLEFDNDASTNEDLDCDWRQAVFVEFTASREDETGDNTVEDDPEQHITPNLVPSSTQTLQNVRVLQSFFAHIVQGALHADITAIVGLFKWTVY